MHDPAPTEPAFLEGLPFAISDLQAALAWAAGRPGTRLAVALDHRCVQEAIEISPPGGKSPRWCIWRDCGGGLHLDDWAKAELDLPCHTLAAALGFIELHQ